MCDCVASAMLNDYERQAWTFIEKGTRIIKLCTELRQLNCNKETVDFALVWLERSKKTPEEIIQMVKLYHKDLEDEK
jgi:hypothetical protein